jgi:4-hydroxy-2-oxoglutarate aldolase
LSIYEAVRAGEHEVALRLQQRLTPLALCVTKRYGIGGLKAALDEIGYTGGRVRAPLQDAVEDARGEIALTLEACGLLEDVLGSGDKFRQAGAAE